jgi:hypothetical protein
MAAGRPFHGSFGAIPRSPLCSALKALLRCSLVWCLARASVCDRRLKTALTLATVLAANLVLRSRGNPAHSSCSFRLFGVLVPGAMGRAGAKYREWAFGLGCQYKTTGNRPLTSRSTGRQKRGAFGSLRLRSGAGYLSVIGPSHQEDQRFHLWS